MGIMRLRYGALLLATLVLACGDDGAGPESPPPPPPPSAVTFAGSVQPIFTRTCAFSSCHAGPSPQQGLDLSAGQSFGNIVSVASREASRLFRIAPRNADSSYLVLKIEGKAGQVGGIGTRMPLGGQLSQAQIDTIRVWVNAGAENN